MNPSRTIVVGVATVEEMDPVLPSAVRLAESTDAELHVLHVFDPPDPAFLPDGQLLSAASALEPSLVPRLVEAIVPRIERQVRQFARAGLRVEVHALPGTPHERLSRFAREMGADVLVVGATRRGPIWRDILGTTAERVLRAACVPVLVLKEPFFRPVERILLTTDLSEFSGRVHDRALPVVESLFGDRALELSTVLVLAHSAALAAVLPFHSMETLAVEAVNRFLAERRPGPAPVRPRVRVGDPAVEINVEAAACRADLIVLGTHGRKGLSRFVFGSVAAAVLRDTARNVLVIPAGDCEDAREAETAAGGLRAPALLPEA